jgi:transposase
MSKPSVPSPAVLFCGIDVSAATLAVAVARPDSSFEQREFPNTDAGHAALIAWLGKRGSAARVSLESTGVYSMGLALALDAAPGIEVAVLNPKTVKRFADSLRRSKTDAADAAALAEYSRRMDFVPWRAPSRNQLQIRILGRHIDGLTKLRTQESNRLHAAQHMASTPRAVLKDLKRAIAAIEKRILTLRREAMAMVQADPALARNFQLLVSLPGVATVAALQLLGELPLLSDGISVRQLVAMAGIDPAHQISGSSVHRPSKISRAGNSHLRRTLYLAALVASRHDAHITAFYQDLLVRHKAKKQALIAVARKLLHAIYGILKTDTPYDGSKLFPQQKPA